MKSNKKRSLFAFVLMLLTIANIYSIPGIWLGTGFISTTDNIATENKKYYITYKDYYNNSKAPEIPEIDINDLKSIKMVGPSLDLSIYPNENFPLGLNISNQIIFPVGINSSSSFRTHEGDFKYKIRSSLDYAQQYTDTFGLYVNIGMDYEINRIATTNRWNSARKTKYHYFSDINGYGALGLLTKINHGYFKVGFDYSHSIQNDSSSFSMQILGGYIF